MSSRYSVVQYFPDSRIDERINIGVVAFDENGLATRFLENWGRVSRFADEDISFLKDFAKQFETVAADDDQIELEPFDEAEGGELIEKMANGWKNSIQLTAPRASLRTVADTLDLIATKFLREPPKKVRNRGRNEAKRITASAVRHALQERLGNQAREMLRRDYRIHGEHDEHSFDIAVVNGKSGLVAHAISFEIKHTKALDQRVDAALWAIDDVKTRYPDFPIGMAALPPRDGNEAFHHAREVVTELGADFVVEDQLYEWAESQVERLDLQLA